MKKLERMNSMKRWLLEIPRAKGVLHVKRLVRSDKRSKRRIRGWWFQKPREGLYIRRHGVISLNKMHSEELPCIEDPAAFGSYMLEVYLCVLLHGMEKTDG